MASAARTTYSYDVADQLEISEDSTGVTTYLFDSDGNQKLTIDPAGDRTTRTWDYENRNTLVELPDGMRVTMEYDPNNRRVSKES